MQRPQASVAQAPLSGSGCDREQDVALATSHGYAGSISHDPTEEMCARSNLTRTQLMIWVGQKLHPGVPLYNMIRTFAFAGHLDPAAFTQAFQTLVECSDALRTVIEEDDGVPQQRVIGAMPSVMETLDFSTTSNPRKTLQDWVEHQGKRAFDLSQRLFDTALITIAPDHFVWYLNQHHLIADAWSASQIYSYMADLYACMLRGQTDQLPMLPRYHTYLEHERDYYRVAASAQPETTALAKAFASAKAYWQAKLATPFQPTHFYGKTSSGRSTHTERVPYDLGDERSQALKTIATAPDVRAPSPHMSLFTVFATVFLAYLHKISGKQDVGFGTPFHNRLTPAFKKTIGLFINMYPLRVEIAPDETFVSLIRKVRTELFATLRHARHNVSDISYDTAYDVVLNYLTISFPEFHGLSVQPAWVHPGHGDENHSLRLQVHDYGATGTFKLYFDFNCEVFDRARQTWAMDHFLTILDHFIADPTQPLGPINVLSAETHEALVVAFNQTGTRYPSEQTIAQLFEAQVARTPHAVALQDGARTLTYAELNQRANQLAHYLIARDVGPEVLVGLGVTRSVEAVIGMLGVLKAGGAYVPLDPAYPQERLAFMLDDTQTPLLLTQHHVVATLPDHQAETFCLDADWETLTPYPETTPGQRATPENLAYVIYTSGSTGKPKGAMIRHRGLTNYVCWATTHYVRDERLAFPLFSSLAFDLTVTSIYTPLISGGRIVIYGEERMAGDLAIVDVIKDNAVDVIKLTPAHLALVKEMNLAQSRLQRMIVGGEDFKRDLAKVISDRFNGELEIYNEYGPTEAVVGCMIHRFDPERDMLPSVPLGKPVANAQMYILDQYLSPVPPEVVGEMYVGGEGVARGYLKRPDVTEERFVPNPFAPGTRLYRTGDLARWNAEGQLQFLGRTDHQVKIKGVRVELGEIEAALLAHDDIQAAVVAVVHGQTGPATAVTHCVRCGLPSTYPDATILDDGVCSICRDFVAYHAEIQPYFKTSDDLRRILAQIKATKQGPYDCLVLLSGGKDSTYMLYQLVKELGVTPLVFSLDNGYISEGAKANIRRVTEDLGVELVWGQTPHMNAIFVDSLKRHSNVCNGCFKTIYTLSMNLAHQRGIKYIFTGLSRGQLFETRLTDMCEARIFDVDQIEYTVLDARKAYHRMDDAVSRLLDVKIFNNDAIFEDMQFIDYYRYADVELDEMYRYLAQHAPWVRPQDTGRSTNCLINDVGIYIHKKERGYHNYALPYSWDVRLGHKDREAALDELDDEISEVGVRHILQQIGYDEVDSQPANREDRLAAYYVATSPLPSSALRAFLARTLPEAMLPAYFIGLEALPLTPNGKVDRTALPDPKHERRDPETEFVAPTTRHEQILTTIWAEVFRLRRVGVHDNFFDLGGDSIISIQIIAKAGQAGLQLTPRQLFEHQTVAALAAVASTVAKVQAEQGVVTGAVPLTPIQRWFFDQDLPHSNHWNQSMLVEMPAEVNVARLEEALGHLLQHHDALRLRVLRTATGWQQVHMHMPDVPALSLLTVDVSNQPQAVRQTMVAETVARLEANHDLAEGQLVQAAHFWYGPDAPSQLFITIHHVAVDGVSWQTLWQDIETVYHQLEQGQAVTLPVKTTSFKQWAEGLAAYAQSDLLRQELEYWLTVADHIQPDIPVDTPAVEANTEASARTVSVGLSAEETHALLHEVPPAYNTQINDVLLTALMQALSVWTGRDALVIHLEGHGREDIDMLEQVDLSRTVGWFTSMFPVGLHLADGAEPGDTLKSVKEQLRRIPNRGIGYGILRYLCQDGRVAEQLSALAAPQVLFNYLGQFDRVLHDSSLFTLNHALTGSRSPHGTRPHVLDINTFVINGRLQMHWTYSENVHHRATITRVANAFAEALRTLISHCLLPESGGVTPSDFPLARLTQADLDRILAIAPDVEDIYPLSSLQQGMLFHTLYAPASGFYVLQFSSLLPPGIDLGAFEQAWQEVVARQAVFRTRFVWEHLDQPLQVVHRAAKLSFTMEDWRHLSPTEQEARLQTYRQDRWRGDMSSVPLTEIIVVRLADDAYRFLWNFHHILFDRWSMSHILAEVIALYEAIRQGRAWPPKRAYRYRDYIAWVDKKGLTHAERYWRDVLRGFTQSTPLLHDRDPGGLPSEEARFGRTAFVLSGAETARLKTLAQHHRLTLSTIVQGAWGLLLSYWSGRDDVVFGAIVPGRPPELPGSQTTVGLFMNTLPARLRVSADDVLLEWLHKHQQDQVMMRQFDYSPLLHVQGWSEVPRGQPLFESAIGVQQATPGQPSLLSLARDFGMSAFDLVDWNSLPLSVAVEVDEQIDVVVKYDLGRFEPSTGQLMQQHFHALLQAIIENPSATLSTLIETLAAGERAHRRVRQQAHKARGSKRLQDVKRKPITISKETPS